MKVITQLEFTPADFEIAKEIAVKLGWGWGTNYVYTSQSGLIGLFYKPQSASGKPAALIKSKEFGFLVVQDLEDLGMEELNK